jgi:hypothetical protein
MSMFRVAFAVVFTCLFSAGLLRAQCGKQGKQPRNPFATSALRMTPNARQQQTPLLTALSRQQRQISLLTVLQRQQLTALENALPKQQNGPTPLQQRQLTALVQQQQYLLTALQNQAALLTMLQQQNTLLTPLQQQHVTTLSRQQTALQNILEQQNNSATLMLGISAPK